MKQFIVFIRIFCVNFNVLIFLGTGASIFQAIEGPREVETKERLEKIRKDFLRDHACVSG